MKLVTALLIIVILMVASTARVRATEPCCIRQAAAIDVHFGRTLTCFTIDSASFLVNTGTEPLIITGIVISDPTAGYFDIKAPRVPDTLDAGETLRIPVTFKPSAPGNFSATITYQVGSLDGDRVGDYVSNLSGEGYDYVALVNIARDYSVFPGTVFKVPIELEDTLDAARIDRLTFRITFDSAVITPGFSLSEIMYSMLEGTLLSGWSMNVTDVSGTTFAIEIVAPPGEYLKGPGYLLNLEFIAGYGNGKSSEIAVEIRAVDRPCVTFITNPGKVTLPTLARFSIRLEPNVAASNQITMYLFAGDPAIVTAQVFGSNGELIQTLIDHQAYSAGSYSSIISTEGLAPGACTLVVRNDQQRFEERFIVLR